MSVLECIHPRDSHTYHDFFQTSQSRGCRGSRTAFSGSLTAIADHVLGDEREHVRHVVVFAPIISESVTMLFLDFSVVSSVEQEMEDVDAQMVMVFQVQKWYGEEKSRSP